MPYSCNRHSAVVLPRRDRGVDFQRAVLEVHVDRVALRTGHIGQNQQFVALLEDIDVGTVAAPAPGAFRRSGLLAVGLVMVVS